jgi:WhiB family transcriptional regulator, redox-sensing transcriptional regulator
MIDDRALTKLSETLQPPTDFRYAQCKGLDVGLFYSDEFDEQQQAKQACHRCEHETACLEYAMAHREVFGIWGGQTADQRTLMRRRRRAAQLREEQREQP